MCVWRRTAREVAIDRNVRSLGALSGASSSRVLNLAAIALAQSENENHPQNPLFKSRVFNSAILLKHRLRPNESDVFSGPRVIATKVIIPFQVADLRVGGQSMFIGQRGFEDLVGEIGNYSQAADKKHDLHVLQMIDSVPSLDPFLLREHLHSHDIVSDSSYFEISAADQQRMYDYTAAEIRKLTALISTAKAGAHNASTERKVTALLSSKVDGKLEPLRATLSLGPEQFSEGVFSWRGFIYYKWALNEFWPSLIRALREIKAMRASGGG
jgi:hypothetical protein